MPARAPYPEAYLAYLAEYHGSRDYFECHEIMEAHWKEQAGTRHAGCWLVLIRLAVAGYHARRGNAAGARKMLAKAANELDAPLMDELGLDGRELAARVARAADAWCGEQGGAASFRDLDLPIRDAGLLRAARTACEAKGWRWGTPSAQADPAVIHRHRTRDRSDVIEARLASAARKQTSRPLP